MASHEDAEALYEYSRRGKIGHVREVLDRGIQADAHIAADGSSPLAIAARGGHADVVELLLLRRASTDIHTDEGSSVLMHAVSGASSVAVRLILQAQANPSEQNEDGITPLMLAAESGSLEVARLLVEAGADPHVVTEEWGSAFDAATEGGKTNVANYLASIGVKRTTPEDRAARGERQVAAGEKWGYDAFDGEEDY
eukprot:TRINITY_DN25648_c0_g1_i1.p1 TRINITY_DN25648_c0_g1~~TRINITY_DN25648_c0_g1_i1.p1  ORF type:complete len:197 (-),score=39.35 TRINITY_DN25648_c0_g1_i1:146-736(-)